MWDLERCEVVEPPLELLRKTGVTEKNTYRRYTPAIAPKTAAMVFSSSSSMVTLFEMQMRLGAGTSEELQDMVELVYAYSGS